MDVKTVICTECGKEVASNASICPYCGGAMENGTTNVTAPPIITTGEQPVTAYPSTHNESISGTDQSQPTTLLEKVKARKKILIAAVAVIGVVILVICLLPATVFMSSNEKMAYEAALKLGEVLILPKTLHIYTALVVEDKEKEAVLMDFSASTQDGGTRRTLAVVEYDGDKCEIHIKHSDETIDYEQEYGDASKALEYSADNAAISLWKLLAAGNGGVSVDVDTINDLLKDE